MKVELRYVDIVRRGMLWLAFGGVVGLVLWSLVLLSTGGDNTRGEVPVVQYRTRRAIPTMVLATAPVAVAPSVVSAFPTVLLPTAPSRGPLPAVVTDRTVTPPANTLSATLVELSIANSPTAPGTTGTRLLTTTSLLLLKELRSQVVTPLEWPGEPIPAKVLMIGLKKGRFLGYAVADLNQRTLKVYSGGRLNSQDIGSNGGTITSRGDVLIEGGRGAYLVPGGDFAKPSFPLRPSRYADVPSSYAPYMGFAVDPSGSMVWMQQSVFYDPPGERSRRVETWVDLVSIDTGETVMTADFQGSWGMAGALDEGVLMREGNRYAVDNTVLSEPGRTLILRPDGSKHYVTPDLDVTPNLEGPAEGWRQGFRILRAYGRHFALRRRDNREMVVVDAETGATYPVPKPSPGTWTGTGLPTIPIESSSWTNSDTFAWAFRTRASGRSLDDWSLYQIRLSDQSVSRIYSRPGPLFAKSVADGTAVLAFTGWPVSPDNDAVINVIGPRGELIPVAAVPDDFFILDAS